jgi:hypothetical protein
VNPHKNLATATVATAPSPPSSGLSLVLTSGHGARMPPVPFNATVWTTGSAPDPTNAEIVKVTNVATDTLTIVRQQEGTAARTILVGDLFIASVTEKDLVEPSSREAPVEDVHIASGDVLLHGNELDCATNNIEVVADGEVVIL